MDTDILVGGKDYLYGDDFLEELTKECQWTSLLDAADASPSEILADAALILVPPVSPDPSAKTSVGSSCSDSGSEDDSKNSSTSGSARQSSQSPLSWMSQFEDETSGNLNLEDVEQFLQNTTPLNHNPIQKCHVNVNDVKVFDRSGPVMAIENGVIKIQAVKLGVQKSNQDFYKIGQLPNGNVINNGNSQGNSVFKVVNENSQIGEYAENKPAIKREQVRLVVDQKKVPCILKKPSNNIVSGHNISMAAENGKIAISPLPQTKSQSPMHTNWDNPKLSPPRCNKEIISTTVAVNVIKYENVQHEELPFDTYPPLSPTLDLSNLSEAEIRAIKKQQRMIKNRESACHSRQKKKEYVTAIEQKLLEAQQEITKLRLENKLLRDQLQMQACGRSRKIPRLDTSILIPKKNIAVLFAMVFMVSLNFNVIGWNSRPFASHPSPHSSSRHLLWTEENADIESPEFEQVNNKTTYGLDCHNTTNVGDMRINQTESIRIASDLSRWIGSGKTLNWTYNAPRKRRNVYFNEEKVAGGLHETYKLIDKLNLDSNLVYIPSANRNPKNIRDRSRLRRMKRSKDLDLDNILNYEALYPKHLKKSVNNFDLNDLSEWNDLLQALHRRDDTFYVVGVGKGEHLLLPAVSHNNTRPPKMALILPAKSGNDSSLNGHVTLMQIDCSVINTTLVKLKSDALPESLRKKDKDPTPKNKIPKNPVENHKGKNSLELNVSNNIPNAHINVSNIPTDKKDSRDDPFAQYLFSKYEETKQKEDFNNILQQNV